MRLLPRNLLHKSSVLRRYTDASCSSLVTRVILAKSRESISIITHWIFAFWPHTCYFKGVLLEVKLSWKVVLQVCEFKNEIFKFKFWTIKFWWIASSKMLNVGVSVWSLPHEWFLCCNSLNRKWLKNWLICKIGKNKLNHGVI